VEGAADHASPEAAEASPATTDGRVILLLNNFITVTRKPGATGRPFPQVEERIRAHYAS
jgi:hypothetical protein